MPISGIFGNHCSSSCLPIEVNVHVLPILASVLVGEVERRARVAVAGSDRAQTTPAGATRGAASSRRPVRPGAAFVRRIVQPAGADAGRGALFSLVPGRILGGYSGGGLARLLGGVLALLDLHAPFPAHGGRHDGYDGVIER